MPTYKYIGVCTYTDNSLGIRVEPGEVVELPFFFEHPKFVLVSTSPDAYMVPHSVDYTLSGTVRLDVSEYSTLTFRLIRDGSAEVKIGSLQVSGVLLSSSSPVYVCHKEILCKGSTVFLCPVDGVPVVRVFYNAVVYAYR